MTLLHGFWGRGATIACLIAISSACAVAADDPAGEQERANAAARKILGQADVLSKQAAVLEAALKSAGLNPPAPDKVNPALTTLVETLVAVLEKVVRNSPGEGLQTLQGRARVQCLAFLKMKKDDAVLSPEDEAFANFQAAKVLLASQLTPTSASRAVTDSPPAVTTPAPGSTTVAASQSVLNENARAAITRYLQTRDVILTTSYTRNFRKPPDDNTRLARLTQFVQAPPGSGSFIEFLSDTVGTPIATWAALSTADQGEILAQINTVVSGTPPTPPAEPVTAPAASNKPDIITTIVEDAANAAGTVFVPGYSVFEPLVDDLIEVGVPAIERWRPLQRCFAGRGAGGSTRYVVPYGASRSRYVIVEP